MSFAVVIPAAGSGSRMGYPVPKVLIELQHKRVSSRPTTTILRRSVTAFAENLDCVGVVVCAPAEWLEECRDALRGLGQVSVIAGGASRQESVRIGTEYLASLEGITNELPVLVHDAARCCVSQEVILRVIEGVENHGAVTAAVKMIDSVCLVDSADGVLSYVERESVRAVQTPQGFLLGDLLKAHREALEKGIHALDDAALVSRIRPVVTVEGARANIKVTVPDDLQVLWNLEN